MDSPIQLANYRIKKFNFEITSEKEDLDYTEPAFNLEVDYEVFDYKGDGNRHRLDLFVELIPSTEDDNYLPFQVEVILQGIFIFTQEIDREERAYHLNISCPSMLYGIARGLIHQISGQTNIGNITIPSIQFSEIAKKKNQELSGDEEDD